jgi:heat shock protein HtpX
LYLSRLREYYADRHSVLVVDNGAEKLSTGLATIVDESRNMSGKNKDKQKNNAFKALFISDPDRAATDSAQLHSMNSASKKDLVKDILSKEPSGADRLLEILSTHPNIVKRLRALQELS